MSTPSEVPARAGALVVVNGEPVGATAETLAGLLMELGYADRRVATAVNGKFVAGPHRAATRLADGDRIEIVAPRQGG